MKTKTGNWIIGIILILIFGGSITINGQSVGDTISIEKHVYLRPDYKKNRKLYFTTNIEKGRVTNIVDKWYQVELLSTRDLLYVHSAFIARPLFKPSDIKVTPSNTFPDQAIRNLKKKYGHPDEESDYRDGSYWSKTYTYHCVGGKYRSFDFIYQNRRWILDTTYTSDCI